VEYHAPALEKGLEILELLAHEPDPLSMNDIARRLKRSRNEIYRMLAVLERRQYLDRLPDDRFELTNRLFWLAMRAAPRRNLIDAALPEMHRLADSLLQSCNLGVLSGTEIVIVARVESPAMLGFAVRVGYRREMWNTSSGRLLFSLQPPEKKARWLELLEQGASPEERERFLAEVEKMGDQGYIMTPSPSVGGIIDIGAPIYDDEPSGPIASLVVPFMSSVALRAGTDEALAAVQQAARTISFTLQHG
jgi:DNA-binding IclR family transcriptional regulator